MRNLSCAILLTLFVLPAAAQVEWPSSFEGGWEWVSTEYADGTLETPASVEYSQQYFFSDQQEFIIYRDRQVYYESLWYWNEIVAGSCMIEFLNIDQSDIVWYWSLTFDETFGLELTDGISATQCGIDVPETKLMKFTYLGTVSNENLEWGELKAWYR